MQDAPVPTPDNELLLRSPRVGAGEAVDQAVEGFGIGGQVGHHHPLML